MIDTYSSSNILEAADAACDNRDGIYGDAAETFQKTAQAWQLILDHPVTREQVALCMAALKIVRATYKPTHMDSWIDLAGYAALGGQLASTSKPSVKRGLTERTNTHVN